MPVSYFTPVKNVYIASAYPDENFSDRVLGNVLFAGTFTGANDIYRSLLQFKLDEPYHGIPPNSTIESALLTLNMYRNDNIGTASVEVFRLGDFFDEKTVTFNNAPPVVIGGPVVIPGFAQGNININMTLTVEGWYDGSIPNTGIELRGLENANNNILGFRSTRFPNIGFWPSLQVSWSKGTLSRTIFEQISGFPRLSSLVDMSGKEQVTFIINNSTNGTLQGSILLINSGIVPVSDPSTQFSIPPGQQRVINYTAAVDFVRLSFTSAGTGSYIVQSKTRDE